MQRREIKQASKGLVLISSPHLLDLLFKLSHPSVVLYPSIHSSTAHADKKIVEARQHNASQSGIKETKVSCLFQQRACGVVMCMQVGHAGAGLFCAFSCNNTSWSNLIWSSPTAGLWNWPSNSWAFFTGIMWRIQTIIITREKMGW